MKNAFWWTLLPKWNVGKKKKNRIAKICGAIPKGVTQHNRNTRKKQQRAEKKKEVIMVKKIQNWTKYTKLQIQNSENVNRINTLRMPYS